MNQENAIEIRNMSKSFKVQYDKANSLKAFLVTKRKNRIHNLEVLKDISLDIKKGDTVALIGTNGSGKSTLLKLMTKIIYPTSGEIQTCGKLTSLLELGAGFHPDFTGRENIYFNASIFGLTRKEIEARMDDIINFSELGNFIDEPIRTYSSGMYMRLAFSIAINVDADILLIDEILAVGDQHFQDKCYAKLEELRDSDKTIVIVSHSLSVVKKLCTRAIWIYKGTFKLDGDPTYVIDEYLKQSAIDNKEKKKQEVQSGKAEYRAITFIDTPVDFTRVDSGTHKIRIDGWSISDYEDSHNELYVGSTKLDTSPFERWDVYNAYSEEFSGFMDASTIGWRVYINPNDYRDQIDEMGYLYVTSKVVSKDGKELTSKKITIVFDER